MTKRSNFPLIISSLKKVLRSKKIKYSELAKALNMSESSIKRLMNSNDASFSKIEEICDYIGITFFELVETCKAEKPKGLTLTQKQENFFQNNTNYFYLFHLLFEEKSTVKEIRKKFKINKLSMNRYLKKLEDLGLLEWHPGDRLVFLVQGNLSLQSGTPLAKHIMKTSLNNLTSIVTGDIEKKERDMLGVFHLREFHATKETIKRFIDSFDSISQQLVIDADREKKIYNLDELEFYTINFGALPKRLYSEDIPNF